MPGDELTATFKGVSARKAVGLVAMNAETDPTRSKEKDNNRNIVAPANFMAGI
jgi:hypothetical protein